MAGRALQPDAAGDLGARTVSDRAEPCLSVRARPSYRARIIDCLEAGRQVTVTVVDSGWSLVEYSGDAGGWVGSRFLDAGAEAEATGEPAAAPPDRPEPAPPSEGAETAALAAARARIASLETQLAELAPLRLEVERLAEAAAERDQLAERLGAAEERVAGLEAELSVARETRDSAAEQTAALGARVEELTTERDDLSARLARTEARVLYLQSDLEQTRAELMRLKGVPQQLLQPQSGTEPVAPPAEPEPVEAAAPEPLPLPVSARVRLDEAVGAVRAWALSWSEQRVEDYLSFYSPSFTPDDGESRESWTARRRQRIAAPRSIEVELEQIVPVVSGERAVVTFVQNYTSDKFSDRVTKTLVLQRVSEGTWQIVEERAVPALPGG